MKSSARFGGCLLFAAIVVLSVGCAAIEKGTHERVDFTSDPSGADVYVNGDLMGTTPVKLKLESKETYRIEFRKKGFDAKTYTITNHVGTKWIVFDVILGVAPVIVDAVTGAWYELDQVSVHAVLEKQQ
jgi:hypothetical protein